MLYKFKSRATGDLILLNEQGLRLLQIMGKEPTAQGIVTVAQIPAAIAAIEAAVAQEEQAMRGAKSHVDADASQEQEGAAADRITLRQRATPFIDMLQRSAAENADVVWGT
ncbi:MAG: DUF1840 domain-containing protein [Giesbergeria sp.]|jgi:cyclopropane-fatty-acyl-phospholipid synthase|nr:DUF1840 domain-containing protein [Simplicispira sp.]MBP6119044.1 DUF1840 domain-containing protein [Giesbergeria sp.]MBP6159289.1 DUF1840 domain-containing protein [Giesbergeria sp.]MBP7083186.1 DUF1840 domain-containing protein [Giesbergeria sp.]MBP9783270.1 DUF1840 domain-containing protein [Giesbergeria sp.]